MAALGVIAVPDRIGTVVPDCAGTVVSYRIGTVAPDFCGTAVPDRIWSAVPDCGGPWNQIIVPDRVKTTAPDLSKTRTRFYRLDCSFRRHRGSANQIVPSLRMLDRTRNAVLQPTSDRPALKHAGGTRILPRTAVVSDQTTVRGISSYQSQCDSRSFRGSSVTDNPGTPPHRKRTRVDCIPTEFKLKTSVVDWLKPRTLRLSGRTFRRRSQSGSCQPLSLCLSRHTRLAVVA